MIFTNTFLKMLVSFMLADIFQIAHFKGLFVEIAPDVPFRC